MTIPTFDQCFYPFLAFLGDKKEHKMQEIYAHLREEFQLSAAEKNQMMPSGQCTVIDGRIGWARTYLKKAGLIEPTARATYRITDLGVELLKQNSQEITKSDLIKFPQFREWVALESCASSNGAKKDESQKAKQELQNDVIDQTPFELVERGYKMIFSDLQQELLQKIKDCPPDFFEKLVVELLLAMGYGGSRQEVFGEVVGKTGDGGIDGVIKEDRLGLDLIYIQAKRWDGAVGANEIRNFLGALDCQKSHKGIIFTTSTFTKAAIETAKSSAKKVVLINGAELSRLMIESNVGVSKNMSYDIKKIDSDYFEFE